MKPYLFWLVFVVLLGFQCHQITSDDLDDDEDWEDDNDVEDEDESVVELVLNVWGKPQIAEAGQEETIGELADRTEQYMNDYVLYKEKMGKYRFECRNYDTRCSQWASKGDCESHYDYMVDFCSPACQTCDRYFDLYLPNSRTIEIEEEEMDDEQPEKLTNPGELVLTIFGVPQYVGPANAATDDEKELIQNVRDLIHRTEVYMEDTVFDDPEYDEVFEHCENHHDHCSYWAATGECESEDYEVFMILECAPACQSCHQLDFETRCPISPDAVSAFEPGGLNPFFREVVENPKWQKEHGPLNILSSPDLNDGPWLITIDNFLSEEECQRFIDIGHAEGFEVSRDVGDDENLDGSHDPVESEERTSTNTWCPDSCRTDEIVGPVHGRVEELTGVDYNHSEWYQILRYETNQFYGEHHDYIHHEWERPQGPRVLTVFLYLNDVEEGGGTHFSRLGITVMPKRGRAVIWPSVLDEDPTDWDERTHHEALPVTAGIKYGANAWIHLRDYKTQHINQCI